MQIKNFFLEGETATLSCLKENTTFVKLNLQKMYIP